MNLLKKIILAVRFAGLRTSLNSVRYTLYRDWLDRGYRSHPAGNPQTPGRLQAADHFPGGARFAFERAELEILFLKPDLARVSWEPGEPPLPYALAAQDWPVVETSLTEGPESWKLASPDLQVTVQVDGSLEFRACSGEPLRSELPPLREGDRWIHKARLSPEERVCGLGEQAWRLDLRGRSYRMWNTDPGGSYGPGTQPLYAPLPIYLGLHAGGSYLAFYENSFPATFHIGDGLLADPDLAEAHFAGGMLRYYFIPGPPARALERYTGLTGRAGLPPRWSLGYHQSRWGYKTESDVREVAAGFREHRMPVSAIHLDIDYMDGYRVFTVDLERFPDLAGLCRELREAGIQVVTILDPGVKQDPEYFVYRDGLQEEVFCKLPNGKPVVGLVWPGWSVFPDFTSAKARAWWRRYYASLLEAGVAGFWHDMNEPTSFAAWGEVSLPRATRHDMDSGGNHSSKGEHSQAHNLYALLMNRAGHEALRAQHPGQRPWIISRSGWAGQQRYAWNWTGDAESSWAGLRMTIPTVLGMGLSGLPFTGPDIGGFSGSPPAELYLRWFQMAAFMPFFRTHSATGTARREPWAYGEPYTGIIRHSLELRYRLMPYFYSLAWEASRTGCPPVRPLFWDRPQDPELWEVDDAFLLGESLLVAPVMAEGAQTREVTLPHGAWYDLWEDTLYRGPGKIELEAPLERIPVLARAGSVVPMEESGRLRLEAYPPAEEGQKGPALELYSDAGEEYGPWRVDHFQLERDGETVTLEWRPGEESGNGEYPFPYPEVEVWLHGEPARRAWVDGVEMQGGGRLVLNRRFRKIRF